MYTYAVLGAGRQGTAAAYDMASWGDAAKIILADVRMDVARESAGRLSRMTGNNIFDPHEVDVRNLDALEEVLEGTDAFLSAVPYYLNFDISRIAIKTRSHMCDLGGNFAIARQQHRLDQEARSAGISIIPNCGQVPGLGTTLVVYALELLDEAIDVLMYDGGIPIEPRDPFKYLLTFHVAGLTNEYAEPAIFIRDWRIQEVETMTEPEFVSFPEPIGTLEAFVAGGGTDTMPWTYEGRLRTLQNKTLRWPGHFGQLRAFYDLGLWDLHPIRVGDMEIVPRDVFHTLFEPKVTFPDDKDLVIIKVLAIGKKNGKDATATVEMIDYFDESTGFTAMERGTGWSAALVAEMMARGDTPRGAGGVERMVPAGPFVRALRVRGLPVTEQIEFN